MITFSKCLAYIVAGQKCSYFLDKIFDVASAFCFANGKDTFDSKSKHHHEQRNKYRHNKTTFVNNTQVVARKRMISRIIALEVFRVAKNKNIDSNGQQYFYWNDD